MTDVMICLVGGQSLANLLPARRLRPGRVLLLHTDTTEEEAERLAHVLEKGGQEAVLIRTQPYDVACVREDVRACLDAYESEATVNLTGGTKVMVLGAYEAARALTLPIVYLESERGASRLYRYRFAGGGLLPDGDPEVLPEGLFDLDDYLRLHLGSYHPAVEQKGPGHEFERLVGDALRGAGFAVARNVRQDNLEIDLVIQDGNNIGVIEVGTGNEARRADKLKQLSLAGRRLRSTYLRCIWVVTQEVPGDIRAAAEAARIEVVPLSRSEASEARVYLDPGDATLLEQKVRAIPTK